MKRSPFPFSRFTFLRRAAVGTAAAAALLVGGIASSSAAGASARSAAVTIATPVVACPGKAAVSSAAGVPVPSATSSTNTGSSKVGSLGTVTDTTTICTYGAFSAASVHYVILIFSHLSRSFPASVAEPYVKAELQKVNAKMPAGSKWSYRFGTVDGVPNVWMSGNITAGTFHITFNASIGFQGTKVAGAEGVDVPTANVSSLEHLAFSTIGL